MIGLSFVASALLLVTGANSATLLFESRLPMRPHLQCALLICMTHEAFLPVWLRAAGAHAMAAVFASL